MKEKCELQDYGDESEPAQEHVGLEKSFISAFVQPLEFLPLEERWKRWVEIIDR